MWQEIKQKEFMRIVTRHGGLFRTRTRWLLFIEVVTLERPAFYQGEEAIMVRHLVSPSKSSATYVSRKSQTRDHWKCSRHFHGNYYTQLCIAACQNQKSQHGLCLGCRASIQLYCSHRLCPGSKCILRIHSSFSVQHNTF